MNGAVRGAPDPAAAGRERGARGVLMVAFQFPPFAGSSAVQRTLRFVRYLPEFGWRPLVLSARELAYETSSDDQLRDIPGGTIVRRAFALDAARHLGIARRYPARWARPDRWISWLPFAVRAGLALVREHRPRLLWSTFPIPTAHLIGARLSERTGLPWVADFRDPMVQPGDPADPEVWRACDRIEQMTVRRAALNVFTTEGTRDLYRARYPDVPQDRFAVVENGYDEDVFADAGVPSRTGHAAPLLLLHSGAIYPLERDPSSFFRALAALREGGAVDPTTLRVRLRATGHDGQIGALVAACGVGDLVELAPPLPYREAILEMMAADALLVLQAGQVRTQVPAKIYEYLRASRPVVALTDLEGETARVLRDAGVRHLAPIDDVQRIASVLAGLVDDVRADRAIAPDPAWVARASRRNRTGELAALLDQVAGAAAPAVERTGRRHDLPSVGRGQ